MFGSVEVKSRPLKLAFIVEPKDIKTLRKIIRVNSVLWGGIYNPIIPLYKTTPKLWREYPKQKLSWSKIVSGYIEGFDPDIIVNCTSKDLPSYLDTPKRATIKLDEIWKEFYSKQKKYYPNYGIGIFELLNDVYDKHFKYKARFPKEVLLPRVDGKHQLMWSAMFGELDPEIEKIVRNDYAEVIDFKELEPSPEVLKDVFMISNLFPLRIVRHELENNSHSHHSKDSYIFYMDADSSADVIDYWNLRALGKTVIPAPIQFAKDESFCHFIRDFIRAEFGVYRHNPDITFGATFVRSRSQKMEDMQAFVTSLDISKFMKDVHPSGHYITLQHWYPRIWDELAIDKDGALPDAISHKQEENEFENMKERIQFRPVVPKFAPKYAFTDGPRFANEIYPKFYGEVEPLAEALPYDYGAQTLRAVADFGSFQKYDFRIGRTGLIKLVKWNHRISWEIPSAEKVFFAWLKDKGFDCTLSSAGLLARQIYLQLEGWLSVFVHQNVLEVFNMMTTKSAEGKGINMQEVMGRLNANDFSGDVYKSLNKRKAFKLGWLTKCPVCGRESWYGVDTLGETLTCPLCSESFPAIQATEKGQWNLKPRGPFSVGNSADGSYSVLLTLHFFEQRHSLHHTPVLSFTAKNQSTGKEIEADLGMLWEESVYGEHEQGVLFGECKTNNEFEEKDFSRMKELGKLFPGAVLLFSTTRETLTEREIRALRKIAKDGRKLWKADRPINPVLILTKKELMDFSGPPHCWQKNNTSPWHGNAHSLLGISNITQQIYLGLPHWEEEARKEIEKKVSKRKKKKI